MKQLKYLFLPECIWDAFGCEELSFEGLNKLEVLEWFDSSRCCFEDLVKLTNLRWLKASLVLKNVNIIQSLMLLLDSNSSIKIDLEIISYDEERVWINAEGRSTVFNKLFSCENILRLVMCIPIGYLPKYEIGWTSHLVDLELRNSNLQDDPMKTLGKLSNLKYLHLLRNSFLGTEMYCYPATDYEKSCILFC